MTNQPTNNGKTHLAEMEEMLNELNDSLDSSQPEQELCVPDPPHQPTPPTPHTVRQNLIAVEAKETEDEEVVDEFEEFVIEKAQSLTELVLSNCAEDRQEATAAINMIKELIASQDKIIHGGSLSRLLQAIDTRSSINMIIVKALESQAKILSARKGPSKHITNNTNTNVESKSLIQMLESGQKKR